MECVICGKEFESKSTRNVLCGDVRCKRIKKYNREHERRKKIGLKRYGDDPNHSIDLLTKNCVYCGDEFKTHKHNMDTCRARKCTNKRTTLLKKERMARMTEEEKLIHQNKRRFYNGVKERSIISSLGVYYDAKCPMCKRKHKVRFEYGSCVEGTIYKYCSLCKQRAEKVDENTMMFGYIPELEEMRYEPVRS